MSAPLFHSDVLFAQRLWSAAGLYHGKLDGKWGPITTAASNAFDAIFVEYQKSLGVFDPRTETAIATLLPKAQMAARRFMQVASKQPFTVKLLSGTRTYAEQNALFAKKPKVTKARAGFSNHNFGIAWDCGVFVGGEYYDGSDKDRAKAAREERTYADLAKAIKAGVPGIEWGGGWRSFPDAPHYQLVTGKSVTQCRTLLEAGKSYI